MNKQEIEKFILKSFDDLYSGCIKISKKWDKKTVPVKVIEEIANILIGNSNKMDLPELSPFKPEYAKMMRLVVKSCKISAKKMDSKSIPFSLLKHFCEHCKTEFSKSFNP